MDIGKKLLRAMTGGIVLLVAACSSSVVSLDTVPQDEASGLELAKMVADGGHCVGFQEEMLNAGDHWDFTCQKAGSIFGIRAATSAAAMTDLTSQLSTEQVPYKAGRSYVVYETESPPGHPKPAADLSPFPGRLVLPRR